MVIRVAVLPRVDQLTKMMPNFWRAVYSGIADQASYTSAVSLIASCHCTVRENRTHGVMLLQCKMTPLSNLRRFCVSRGIKTSLVHRVIEGKPFSLPYNILATAHIFKIDKNAVSNNFSRKCTVVLPGAPFINMV